MEKKYLISLVSLLVLLAAGWFFYAFFLDSGKGEMKIQQDSADINIEEKGEERLLQEDNGAKVEVEESTKTAKQLADEFKEELQRPVETVIESENIIKNPSEKDETASFDIKNNLVGFGFSRSDGRKIDTIVIHSSYNSLDGDEYDVDKIVDIYESYGVAAHYIIGRDGSIIRLVEEKDVAYHAGISKVPDGRTNVNAFSIGIEMVGNKTDGYTDLQYGAVSYLVEKIKGDYEIKYVLGHKDIAPDRKDDPWSFDFNKLK